YVALLAQLLDVGLALVHRQVAPEPGQLGVPALRPVAGCEVADLADKLQRRRRDLPGRARRRQEHAVLAHRPRLLWRCRSDRDHSLARQSWQDAVAPPRERLEGVFVAAVGAQAPGVGAIDFTGA